MPRPWPWYPPDARMMKEAADHVDPTPVVFVVDDDPSVRRAVARLLRTMGMRVEAFASPLAFLEAAPEVASGCVLLDLQMPGLNGLELQRRMIDAGILLPVVFITGHGDIPASVRAMKAGAVDFLQKPFDDEALMDAVEQAIVLHAKRRERQTTSEDVDARLARLTPRETDVMELVAAGLRNRLVAVELGISERTVKVHRGRVMKKLEVSSLPDLVRMVEIRDAPGAVVGTARTSGVPLP